MERKKFALEATYCRWINSHLEKAHLHVSDLYLDLRDGKILLKLLEILTGERIGSPSNHHLRKDKLNNCEKTLKYLRDNYGLTGVSAEDIVDGNSKIILDLIWAIIYIFLIRTIKVNGENIGGTDTLLRWARDVTAGYAGVALADFSTSWSNGLAFNAIIHSHRPDLIDADLVASVTALDAINYSFRVASKELGIVRLLEPEDLESTRLEEKTIIMYVALLYHKLHTEKEESMEIVNTSKVNLLATDIRHWITARTQEMLAMKIPETLPEMRGLLVALDSTMLEEKQNKLRIARLDRSGAVYNEVRDILAQMEIAEAAFRNTLLAAMELEEIYEKYREEYKGQTIQLRETLELVANADNKRFSEHIELAENFNNHANLYERIHELAAKIVAHGHKYAETVQDCEEQIVSKLDLIKTLLFEKGVHIFKTELRSISCKYLVVIAKILKKSDVKGLQARFMEESMDLEKVNGIYESLEMEMAHYKSYLENLLKLSVVLESYTTNAKSSGVLKNWSDSKQTATKRLKVLEDVYQIIVFYMEVNDMVIILRERRKDGCKDLGEAMERINTHANSLIKKQILGFECFDALLGNNWMRNGNGLCVDKTRICVVEMYEHYLREHRDVDEVDRLLPDLEKCNDHSEEPEPCITEQFKKIRDAWEKLATGGTTRVTEITHCDETARPSSPPDFNKEEPTPLPRGTILTRWLQSARGVEVLKISSLLIFWLLWRSFRRYMHRIAFNE